MRFLHGRRVDRETRQEREWRVIKTSFSFIERRTREEVGERGGGREGATTIARTSFSPKATNVMDDFVR